MTFREGLSSVRQTPNSCGEYLFQRQGARLHAILHIDICTPCRKLHWVVAIQKDIISYSYHDWLCTILLNHRYLHCSGFGQPKWQTSCPPRIQRQYAAEERIWCWYVATRAARSWLKSVTLVYADVRMRLWWWSTFCIASIRRNCWADDVDKSIHELGYVFLCCMSIIIL